MIKNTYLQIAFLGLTVTYAGFNSFLMGMEVATIEVGSFDASNYRKEYYLGLAQIIGTYINSLAYTCPTTIQEAVCNLNHFTRIALTQPLFFANTTLCRVNNEYIPENPLQEGLLSALKEVLNNNERCVENIRFIVAYIQQNAFRVKVDTLEKYLEPFILGHIKDLLDPKELIPLKTLSTNFKDVRALQKITPSLLAIGLANGEIKIVDHISEECLATLTGHTHPIKYIVKAGPIFASGSEDGMIKAWDRNTYNCISTLLSQGSLESLVKVGPSLIASASGKTIQVWDLNTHTSTTLQSQQHIYSLAAMKEGETLIAGGEEGVHVWDLRNNSYSYGFPLTGRVYDVVWLDSSRFATQTGGTSRILFIWDVHEKRPVKSRGDSSFVGRHASNHLTRINSNTLVGGGSYLGWWVLDEKNHFNRIYKYYKAGEQLSCITRMNNKMFATGNYKGDISFWYLSGLDKSLQEAVGNIKRNQQQYMIDAVKKIYPAEFNNGTGLILQPARSENTKRSYILGDHRLEGIGSQVENSHLHFDKSI